MSKIISYMKGHQITQKEFDVVKTKVLKDMNKSSKNLNEILALGYFKENKNILCWSKKGIVDYDVYKKYGQKITNCEYTSINNYI